MDLSLTEAQEQLVASFGALLQKHSPMQVVRDSEPHGHEPELWAMLLDTGALAMAVPEPAGGWGASLLDVELVAEELGRHCAPVPVVEVQVAARLLASLGDPAAALLTAVLDGASLTTLAVRPAVDGTARLVPGGSVADRVVVRSRGSLGVIETDGSTQVPNLACLPLADVAVADVDELARGSEAVEAFERAVDEWLVLTAGSLVGTAAAALDVAVAYAKERTAFGSPIGAYQGIAHPLADSATAIDGARLLAREAAWTLDRGRAEGRELAAMAFAFAADTARDATYRAVHTLGGYGVMVEYDTTVMYRRARGLAGIFGGSSAAYRRVAAVRLGGR